MRIGLRSGFAGQVAARFVKWGQVATFVVAAGIVAACGGGGGDGGGGGTPSAANTVPVTVDRGLVGVVNIPNVSVTICVPGTSVCQTIDHVQLDTASYGLRVVNTALNSTMLAQLQQASVSGQPLAECPHFADGYTWGSIRNADVKLGGEAAGNIPIQVIGDMSSSTVPQACQNFGVGNNTAQDLGANGILGVGVAPVDCGAACVGSAASSNYYTCPGGLSSTSCTATAVQISQQVANPVPHFATDNNGLILELPQISDAGQASASGTLVFGIGTAANNAMTASQQFQTTQWGDLVGSTFNGTTVTAFLDSGSNGLFFEDSALQQCGGNLQGFYCPPSTQTLSATLQGANGAKATVNFNVANASALFGNGSNFAFNDLAGTIGSSTTLDLGLPFHFGRNVFVGMDRTGSGGSAPFVAF